MIWDDIAALNAAKPEGDPHWIYLGGYHLDDDGGLAIRLDRNFGADVVELQPLDTATNDALGLALLTTGNVILSRLNLTDRNHLRSAMQSVGLTMADLMKDHPDDRDRRLIELARAKWIYGQRDEQDRVICYDPERAKDNDPECWRIDEEADGEEGLREAFMAELD